MDLPRFGTADMQSTRFCDLRFRVGASYLYCHQVKLFFFCFFNPYPMKTPCTDTRYLLTKLRTGRLQAHDSDTRHEAESSRGCSEQSGLPDHVSIEAQVSEMQHLQD